MIVHTHTNRWVKLKTMEAMLSNVIDLTPMLAITPMKPTVLWTFWKQMYEDNNCIYNIYIRMYLPISIVIVSHVAQKSDREWVKMVESFLSSRRWMSLFDVLYSPLTYSWFVVVSMMLLIGCCSILMLWRMALLPLAVHHVTWLIQMIVYLSHMRMEWTRCLFHLIPLDWCVLCVCVYP